MRLTWDEAKRKSNLAKHGLDFAEAYRVFDGVVALQRDRRFAYDEVRMTAVGMLDDLVVIVVNVEAHELMRIISMPVLANEADRDETNIYFENFSSN